jgi:outer membrane protein
MEEQYTQKGVLIMKQILILALLLSANIGFSDTLFGVYAGAQTWLYNTSGDLRANNLNYNNAFSDIDKNSENSNSIFIALEHGVPLVPNIKLRHTNFEVDNFVNLDLVCVLDFPNRCFPETSFDLSHTDLTLYYELLDNWVNLDLGISALYFGGNIDFDTELDADINYSKIVPALYGKALFEMPITDLSTSLTMNIGSISHTRVSDIELALQYKLSLGFRIEAGIRQQHISLERFNGTDLNSSATGVFAGLYFHF